VGFLEDWQLSYEEINELLTQNPSFRGFVLGYAAELKVRELWFNEHVPSVSNVVKYRDHDRTKKGDIAFDYHGSRFTVEVKSLDTNSIRSLSTGFRATFQCNGSDSRPVKFPDGSHAITNYVAANEFDLLAVNLFGFSREWIFAFAKNRDLPRLSDYRRRGKKFTEYQRKLLLASPIEISYPVRPPFTFEPWRLLDEIIDERAAGIAGPEVVIEPTAEGGRRGKQLHLIAETQVDESSSETLGLA
jgi:hypothetical protein